MNGYTPTRVFVACSGLGNIQRGFESFSHECFRILNVEPTLDMYLFKGGDHAVDEGRRIWNIRRAGAAARWLRPAVEWTARHTGRRVEGDYFLEQATFTLALLPWIQWHRPQVIYYSDITVGNILARWRRKSGNGYKLLFCNGAMLARGFPECDCIQQISPMYLQQAAGSGVSTEKQCLLPLGFDLSPDLSLPSTPEKEALRRRLGLPIDRKIILSVGMLDRLVKRMDYVVAEVARLPEPRPHVVLLGQINEESADVRRLAGQTLGLENVTIRTVPQSQVSDYYRAANVFVLASLKEAFGRVLVEAMAHGLPTIAHDYEGARYVLGPLGYLTDLRQTGRLTDLLGRTLTAAVDAGQALERHQSVYQRFSWDRLTTRYVDMIKRIAGQAADD